MFKEELRYDYDLNDRSVVFDVGGFKGEFADNIFKKFGCRVYCFEPVFEIVNKDILVFNFGLGAANEEKRIKVDGNKTGIFCQSGQEITVTMVDVVDFIQGHNISNIDLFKVNIEGMEYDLLPRLIESGLISVIDNLQVQFHYSLRSDELMWKIQEKLKETHTLTWQYRYVWENWKRNETNQK